MTRTVIWNDSFPPSQRMKFWSVLYDMVIIMYNINTVRSSVIGTVEKRGCLEAKGWMYKKSMLSQFFIQYFIVILVQNKFSVSLTIDL